MFNTVVELVVGDNARLRYVCGQDLSERSWIFGTQRAEVGRDGALDWVALGFGSARGHVRMETRLGGPGRRGAGHRRLRHPRPPAHRLRHHPGARGAQHHLRPRLPRRARRAARRAVWKGNIIVDPGAQKTDAFQESRNLLISKRAHADAIPGLEIQANDVRCTHAAAVAQVDPEQLFYLRSHGLGEEIAKRLVIEGFLAALVERFEQGPVREVLAAALERRLNAVLELGCGRAVYDGRRWRALPPNDRAGLREVRPRRPDLRAGAAGGPRPRRRPADAGPRRGDRRAAGRVPLGGRDRPRYRGRARARDAARQP